MTTIFLSYSKADSGIARRLAGALRDAGAEVFWYEDEQYQGKEFVDLIERALVRSDLFVAVMSPDYLDSYWCRQEGQLAKSRQGDLRRQFIYVVEVTQTALEDGGFFRNVAWIDLRPPVDEAMLRRVVAAVAPTPDQPMPSRPDGERHGGFQDRMEELDKIANTVFTKGRQEFWLVLAPPRMGKSWFLKRVSEQFTQKRPEGLARTIDLGGSPVTLRSDGWSLLHALLDVDRDPSEEPDEMVLARAVDKRSCPQVYLLDNADLMTDKCVTEFRSALTSIYRRLSSAASPSQFSVVVASRHQRDWASFSGLGKAKPFRLLALSEFPVDVVQEAVAALQRPFGQDQLELWAHELHKLCEGLPALLVASIEWAVDDGFMDARNCATNKAFERVAHSYIEQELLSSASLLPHGNADAAAQHFVLDKALRAITPYRLFTVSHLTHHVTQDADFRGALADSGWTVDQLWEALGRTALLEQQSQDLWQVLSPPIRRLLYRHYYRGTDERVSVHASARRFYERWANPADIRGWCVAFVECLWHEAMSLRYQAPGELSQSLPRAAVELAGLLGKPESRYTSRELVAFIHNRMRGDVEFATLVESDDQLFYRLQELIAETISAGGE